MLKREWTFGKDELSVTHGAVVAHHRLAAEAGLEMLQDGGNAIDAAVAAAFVMSVVEPFMSGLGGGGYMVVHLAERGETHVVDFGMQAPAAARPDMFELLPDPAPDPYTFRKVVEDANKRSYLAAAVPGEPAGLCAALERFGTLPRGTVMAPAVRLAADGFPMHWFLALEIYNHLDWFARFPETGAAFLKNRGSYKAPLLETAGDLFRQPDLARTLEAIAEGGAPAFYRGGLARRIAEHVQANGGLMIEQDFADYAVRVVPPLTATYRRAEVAAVPDVCAGATVVESLNMLERFDLASLGHNSADTLHLVAEACRRAFVDRFAYHGDPEYADVPYAGLLSKEYAAARATEISADRAAPDVGPGDPWPYGPTAAPVGQAPGHAGAGVGDTTQISVADEARNLVSMTKTASHVMVPGTGVMMNLGLQWFDPEPGYPNSIAGRKRLLTNMSPLILLRQGRPFAAYGSPGARRIPNSLTQVALNLVDFRLGIQEAVSAPKLDCSTRQTLVDDRLAEEVRADLRRRGHRLEERHEDLGYMSFARPNGVVVDDDGALRAGSYPFFHGVAAGY